MRNRLWNWFVGKVPIQKKLVISFSILVFIPIITLGVYSFSVANQNLLKQTQKTMENNLQRLIVEMEDRFQRENDFTKYLAYNLEFREILESHPNDKVAMAQALNKTIEPTLWYFISSDTNIKGIKIVAPYVKNDIGAFLETSEKYEDKEWYQEHKTNFKTKWSVEDGNLFATRTILDITTTSQLIGVLRTELYLKRLIEPITSMNFLDNGIIVLDENQEIVYEKTIKDEKIQNKVWELILGNKDLEEANTKKYLLKAGEITRSGWTVYCYIDKKIISNQTHSILTSTLLVVMVCIIVVNIFITIFSRTLSKRLLLLSKKAEEVAEGHLDNPYYTQDTDEIGIVTNSLALMTERLQDTINQVYKIEIEKKASELAALQAMINPHFLYNCLSSIKWKAIKKGEDEIGEIAGLIATFYRTTLNNGQQKTSVANELENIKSYVEIQRQTHDNSFEVEYRIALSSMNYTMLNFLLQPIVENAIKHGIDYKEDQREKGKIVVEVEEDESYLIFNIYNNGPVIDVEMLYTILNTPGNGYGIYNIKERIALYYGESCGLKASVTQDGLTCFTIRILKEVQLKEVQ